MPKYKGAVYVKEGVPDYDEGQGEDGQYLGATWTRLRQAGLDEKVTEEYRKAYAKDRQAAKAGRSCGLCIGGDAEVKAAKGRWWRTHFPPPVILEGLRNVSGEADQSGDCFDTGSECVAGNDGEVAGEIVAEPEVQNATLPNDDGVVAPVSEDVPVESEPARVKAKVKRDTLTYGSEQNPCDNSCPIPEGIEALSMEDLLLAGGFAFKYAMHVKTGRVKIRNAPGSVSGAWLMVEYALTDFKGFCAFYFEKLKRFEDERDAKRQQERGRLVDLDGKLPKLLKRLSKAE